MFTTTPSSWLDSFCFRDWFENVLLKDARRKEGKKVLLGDNLQTHMSGKVISRCAEENIEFVCLPAHSTDKMQPLDVGFFGQLKGYWKKLLRAYGQQYPGAKNLDKKFFPQKLKELLNCIDSAALNFCAVWDLSH